MAPGGGVRMSIGALAPVRERPESLGASRPAWLDQLLRIDYLLVLAVLMVTGFGLLSLWGATREVGALGGVAPRQAVFLVVAMLAMLVTVLVDYRVINRAALWIYAGNMVALLYVLIAGSRINGARSWISMGPINWQPSETMKIATVLVCAQWLALNPDKSKSLSSVVFPAIICGAPSLLILAQPDFGTAVIFFLLFMSMMWVSGVNRRWLGVIALSALIGIGAAYPMLKPYQKARIQVFLNPERDPLGEGYNVIQSKIAVGSGGLFGKGFGEGTQSTHRFLPEYHTDFIFAATVEQFGFVGGILLLGGLALIALRMVHAMDVARDRFGGLVAGGLLAIFSAHVLMNVAMTMGLAPVTGIPLPFMSYGGSFLVTTFVLVGLVLNVGSRRFTFIR
jgi:rod shape determining protein RodA